MEASLLLLSYRSLHLIAQTDKTSCRYAYETTPSLAPYCHLHELVAGIVLLPESISVDLAGCEAKAPCIAYLLYRWWMRFVLIQRQASSRDIVVSLFANTLP
jgi:hypothetical protein